MITASDALAHTAAIVARSSRDYLDFWWTCQGHWGHDLELMRKEQELRIDLCAGFHFLLERHFSVPDWPADAWVDALFPDRITVHGRDALEIPGTFLWVEGQDRWWLEPGFASVALDARKFTLKLGDAARGLRQTPYAQNRRAKAWVEPANWMFVFQGRLDAAS